MSKKDKQLTRPLKGFGWNLWKVEDPDYYSKEETDALLANKISAETLHTTLNDYFTKTETNNLVTGLNTLIVTNSNNIDKVSNNLTLAYQDLSKKITDIDPKIVANTTSINQNALSITDNRTKIEEVKTSLETTNTNLETTNTNLELKADKTEITGLDNKIQSNENRLTVLEARPSKIVLFEGESKLFESKAKADAFIAKYSLVEGTDFKRETRRYPIGIGDNGSLIENKLSQSQLPKLQGSFRMVDRWCVGKDWFLKNPATSGLFSHKKVNAPVFDIKGENGASSQYYDMLFQLNPNNQTNNISSYIERYEIIFLKEVIR